MDLDISRNPIVPAVDDPRNSILAKFNDPEYSRRIMILNLSYIDMTEVPDGLTKLKCKFTKFNGTLALEYWHIYGLFVLDNYSIIPQNSH